MKVFIPFAIDSAGRDYLTEQGHELDLGSEGDTSATIMANAECDAIIARAGVYSRDLMDAAPHLKVIARHGVGYDAVDIDYAASQGIWVTNTPEALSFTVAEHTMCLILACSRRLTTLHEALQHNDFDITATVQGVDLEGKTLGLIGLGRIGRVVAEKARLGFGMRVIGYDPAVRGGISDVGIEVSMQGVLEKADFVSMHTALNETSRHLIGEDEFNRMKPTAYFINTSRGAVVQEKAMIAALQTGTIKGAGLDVFDPEPPSGDNPLLSMENVVVTPHAASGTEECMRRMSLHAAMSVQEVLSGNEPKWAVNTPLNPRNR